MTTNAKRWSFSCGERGRNRVRAFAHPKTGTLFLEFYEPVCDSRRRKPTRVALGHRDQERAKAAAELLSAKLRTAEPPTRGHIRLGALFDNYLREVTPSKAPSTQAHDRRCAALFCQAFGASREARALSRREWDRFIAERRSGRLAPVGQERKSGTPKPKPRAVRNRVIAYDLQWLLAVLHWATRAGDGRGDVLLDRNPLDGLELPREENPQRPRLDASAYQKLQAVASDVSALFALALVLAHETGHRINSIRLLRWSDVDLEARTVRWRAANDKIGYEHTTPLSVDAAAALDAERSRMPAIGDAWIFPRADTLSEPRSRHAFNEWWQRGVELAGLPAVARRGWHSLRRKFATELKSIPLTDLCALGGWKEAQTVLKCYQQPDEDTMRTALEQRQMLRIGNGS